MKRIAWIVVVVVAWGGLARAESRQELDRRLRAELARQAPAALPAWDAAVADTDRTDADAAVRDYRKVVELAPTFDAAYRRLGGALAATGHIDEAKAAYDQAMQLSGSPLNKAAFGELLLSSASAEDRDLGARLAHAAAAAAPDDPYVLAIDCMAYATAAQLPEAERCVERVLGMEPTNTLANVAGAIAAAGQGRYDNALARLEVARPGMVPAAYDQLRAQIEAARRGELEEAPRDADRGAPAWIGAGLWVLAGWAAGLLLLFVVGAILSFVTLRSVERTATAARGRDAAMPGGLRRAYRIVLAIASVYFYLSVPIVVGTVLFAGGAVIYGVLSAGYIAPKLFIGVILLVGLTVTAIARSLFVKRLADDPGVRLDLAQEPALRDALAEVAGVVGTREVDAVYLLPGTEIAVAERRVPGRQGKERRLILGVGVLEGMKKGWLKSILAHEHGHFRNEDTAGGDVALAVRRSLVVMTIRLARSGAAAWYNPAWLFVRMYYAAFLRISQGASRLQEVLADRWAALAYGSAAFEAGLRHVIARDALFEKRAQHVLADVIDRKQPLANLYQHEPAKPFDPRDAEGDAAFAMDRPPAPYDSHPAPRQRLAWVAALDAPARANPDDDEPAWSLFRDRAEIERRMTDHVRDAVAKNHGVRIAAA
jgi:Zn-dependent protease with chaperone function/Flp pilus assembly protein TadD